MKPFVIIIAIFAIFLVSNNNDINAFSKTGCEGDCKKCHSLTKEEVNNVLKKLNAQNIKILDIQLSPVKSLWEITVDENGNRGLFYVDFSKRYLVSGQIIEIDTGSNKTAEKAEKIKVIRKVDVSKIPLNDALVMGSNSNNNGNGFKRVIVFTDPDCPFCGKLHNEIKKVLEKRKDIVFYLKLFPLPGHKDSQWKSKSIVCSKSIKMLEDNFDKKFISKNDCDTKEIDNNIKLAKTLNITGTPTVIVPDGSVYSGTMPAEKLIEIIDNPQKK